VKIDLEHIRNVLTSEMLKREVLEDDKAQQASKKISKMSRASGKAQRARKNSTEATGESAGTGSAGDDTQAT